MVSQFQWEKGKYVIDAERAAEVARLHYQSNLLNQDIGGLFPPGVNQTTMHDVLDLACGPGGWVLQVARTHPTCRVIGVDISRTMVEYASSHAEVQNLSNADFLVQDILKPFAFADNSFDVINARTIFAFMQNEAWNPMLKECYRVLRPGGVICLTEGEWPLTNSEALEHYGKAFSSALALSGRSFSPIARNVGITPMLSHLLRQAGYCHVRAQPHAVDISTGMPEYDGYTQNLTALLQLLIPYLVSAGVIGRAEADALTQQVMFEILDENFCGLILMLVAWGEKPRS
jgi:SAM-dependent methyltransferase